MVDQPMQTPFRLRRCFDSAVFTGPPQHGRILPAFVSIAEAVTLVPRSLMYSPAQDAVLAGKLDTFVNPFRSLTTPLTRQCQSCVAHQCTPTQPPTCRVAVIGIPQQSAPYRITTYSSPTPRRYALGHGNDVRVGPGMVDIQRR